MIDDRCNTPRRARSDYSLNLVDVCADRGRLCHQGFRLFFCARAVCVLLSYRQSPLQRLAISFFCRLLPHAVGSSAVAVVFLKSEPTPTRGRLTYCLIRIFYYSRTTLLLTIFQLRTLIPAATNVSPDSLSGLLPGTPRPTILVKSYS